MTVNLGNRDSITRSPLSSVTVAITTSNATSPVVNLAGSSVTTLRSPSGDISTVAIHRKGIDGVYELAQMFLNGSAVNLSFTLTTDQPLTVPTIGLYDVRFVGNAAGNLEVEPTG